MNMLIMISGLPGSGKSYFAAALAEKVGAMYLNSDKTRKSLGKIGKYSKEDKMEVYQVMANRAAEGLSKKEPVIVDATFHLQEARDIFLQLAQRYSNEYLFIKVVAQEDLIKGRLQQPREDSEADFEVYLNIRDAYEPIKGNFLQLESTNSNLEVMLAQAVAYLENYGGKGN